MPSWFFMNNPPASLRPLEAFRIVAWKACVFAEERWLLGPQYYCPTCELPEKDLQAGCPKCPLTALYNSAFKNAALEEIERRGRMPANVTIEQLISIHSTVSQILAENGDQISRDWEKSFVELVRIIRQERDQQRYINDWNAYQEMKKPK